VARAERELLSAREGRVSAELALAELTGLASDVPVETPTPPEIPWASPDEALEAAARRPAIVAADLRARAARMQGVATGLGWLPTIDGRFTWSYSGNTGFSDDPSMWMVVVEADWVLWDGGYRIAEQRRAAVQARMAKLAGDKARLDTEERVRGLWEKHASAVAGLAAVERERALSEENSRIAATAFEAGLVTLLELEDARLGLQAAELALLSTRMERDLAAIDLLAAVGRRLSGAP
jgi:outer membrane protein TolC